MAQLSLLLLFLAIFSTTLHAIPEAYPHYAYTNNRPAIVSGSGYELPAAPKNENLLQKALHRFGFNHKAPAKSNTVPQLGAPDGRRKNPAVKFQDNVPSSKQARTEFSYDENSFNGPSKWKNFAPECGGIRQSPISIESKDLTVASVWKRFEWHDYSRVPGAMELENNGHSVQLSATYFGHRRPSIAFGPLVGSYVFQQLHFHWGVDNDQGSEHVVNSVRYPMECHLVHYKEEYGSMDEALKHSDGIAVVAFMFDVKDDALPNAGMAKLVSAFSQVGSPGPAKPVNTFALTELIRPFVDNYATYTGSLTTPPCTQAVTWLIGSQPQYISQDQMNKFRELKGSHGPMSGNFRPTQPLNGRTVYYIPY